MLRTCRSIFCVSVCSTTTTTTSPCDNMLWIFCLTEVAHLWIAVTATTVNIYVSFSGFRLACYCTLVTVEFGREINSPKITKQWRNSQGNKQAYNLYMYEPLPSTLLICTCINSSPIACPSSSVLCWCPLCFVLFHFILAVFLCFVLVHTFLFCVWF